MCVGMSKLPMHDPSGGPGGECPGPKVCMERARVYYEVEGFLAKEAAKDKIDWDSVESHGRAFIAGVLFGLFIAFVVVAR